MKLVPTAISRKVARQALMAQKNSPTLLFGVGVTGMVGSTVLACRATLKMHEVLDVAQRDLETARGIDHENYSERDRKKDITIIYSRSIIRTGRMYLPALVLGGASIACLTRSHSILMERNLALTAAYTVVDEAFTKYRGRVIEKYGEEQDREFRYAGEEVEIVGDDGKLKTVMRAGEDPDGSMYARWFDEYSSRSWSVEPTYNEAFLRCQQNYANDMLKARGHVFLNEIYDSLGMERTKAGQAVGWVLNGDGDNYIDFGFDSHPDWSFNGRDGAILLDFNVDGIIWNKIDKQEGAA